MGQSSPKPPNSRQRSQRAREEILAATWARFERTGLRDLTVEAIAVDAGVSKATIYRWWSSKAAVLMEALQQELDPQIRFPDTGSVREDLELQVDTVIEAFTETRAGRAYLSLVAESYQDAALAQALSEQYIVHRRDAAREVFERGIGRGELPTSLDVDLAIDALYGAVYYRCLVSHATPPTGYAKALVAQLHPS